MTSQGDNDGAALVRSAGGEGGAWLWPPRRTEHLLGDDDFIVSLRRRLLVADPAASGGAPCAHRATTTGALCGCVSQRRYGVHAVCCRTGPGSVRRRNWCRDVLATWLREVGDGDSVLTEQHVPGWDRMTRQGIEQVVLDVILVTNSGRVAVDVSV